MADRSCVYIPNFNRRELLEGVLRSLQTQTAPHDVVVIDNGSTDDSVAFVRNEFPDVHIIALAENLGFGKALNRAVRQYPADFAIFVNNDAECEATFVERLVEAVDARTASVAGVLLQHADPDRIDSAGVVADETLLAWDYLHGRPSGDAFSAPAPLGPTGGGGLYRLDAFNAAGGFDELIFAYLEDLDLAMRLQAIGGECRLAPAARALHRHSATLGSGSARKNELMGWSRGYLMRRYGVLRTPRRAVRAVCGEAVICGGQLWFDHTASGLQGRWKGWRAARGLPPRAWPTAGLLDVSVATMLRERAGRRAVQRALRTET